MNKFLLSSVLFAFLSFSLAAQSKIDSTQIYLRNVKILDFMEETFRLGNVLIVDDLISEIKLGASKKDREGVINYDLNGKYLIPGLIDAHVHLATDPSGADNLEHNKKRLEYLLQNGVTTVRDMAGDTRLLAYLARQALLDEIPSPDIFYSSLVAGQTFFSDPRTKLSARGATSGECVWMKTVHAESDFDRLVAEAKGTGATGIKIYANLDQNIVQKVTNAAHQQNMKVWAHASVFPARPSEISGAGVDVISHATLLAWEDVEDIPTDAFQRYKTSFEFDIRKASYANLMDTLKTKGTIIDATISVFKAHGRDKNTYNRGVALTKLAYQKNIKIGVGSDIDLNEFPETSPMLQEMIALNEDVGMRPIDILKSATIINAEMIGQEKNIGSIHKGKKANLLILNANPISDIGNCAKIALVIKNGVVVQR